MNNEANKAVPKIRRKTQKFANHVKSAPMCTIADAVHNIATENIEIEGETTHLVANCTQRFGKVTAPSAGAMLQPGDDTMIVWKMQSVESAPKSIDIEIRDAKTNFPVQTIATGVRNVGYHIWNIDPSLDNISMPCRIFIGSITDCYGDDFQIYSDQFTFVLAQNSAEQQAAAPRKSSNRSSTKCKLTWSASLEGESSRSKSQKKMPAISASASTSAAEKASTAPTVAKISTQSETATRDAGRRTVAGNFLSALEPADSNSSCVGGSSTVILPNIDLDWSLYPEFTYSCVYMNAARVRRGLREILRNPNITSTTVLQSGEDAGLFCICYLIQTYFKNKISAEAETQIASGVYEPPETQKKIWQQLQSVWQTTEMFRKLSRRISVSSAERLQSFSSLASAAQNSNRKKTKTQAEDSLEKHAKRYNKKSKTLDEALENLTI